MPEAVSLRALGRQLGVSDTAIRKGIRSGRLRLSVGERNGRPVILDTALAAQEWAAGASRPPREARSASAPAAPPPAAVNGSGTLADVQRAIAIQRERKLRLDNDERERRLIPFDDAERAQQATAAAVKAQLLAVSHRAVLAGLPREHEPLVRRLIVEALRELSEIRTLGALVDAGDAA